MIEAGQRDPLIQRLQGYGMAESDIERLTGVSLARIKDVVTRAGQASATSSTPA